MSREATKARQAAKAALNGKAPPKAAPKTTTVPLDPFSVDTPWSEPVETATLLDELVALLHRFVVLPPGGEFAIALWILHTYVFDAFDFTPYLGITSPVRQCGKTTLLELLRYLAYRAQLTGGITAAALYRRIDRLHPVMLIDELDARRNADGSENLRAVLDTGFHRLGCFTISVAVGGNKYEEQDFSTFSPKVLVSIGRLWDTVASRSIPIHLRRATKDELVRLDRIRGDRIDDQCRAYRQKALRWREALHDTLRSGSCSDPVVPDQLGARQADIWRPLLTIADVAGGDWPTVARNAACELHGVAEDETDYGLLLLGDLRDIFARAPEGKVSTAVILDELAKLDDRPWPEYRHGRAITANGLASLVGRFGIKPKNVRIGVTVQKGYDVDQLHPLFTRYLPLPPDSLATAATPSGAGSGVAGVAPAPGDGGTRYETSLDL